ncbi:MAG TPA: LD-carboxypeptidase [Polyangiaceae bacterium]|nr:LD-carboxypeptidase [Polyangiaceae bacterium]
MLQFLTPPALQKGDLVRVIAPSGTFNRSLFLRGLGWLGEHFKVRFRPDIFERDLFTAGSRARRANELNEALSCPDTRAIVAARGGFGAGEIARAANFVHLRTAPKWLVGFSDITALHVEAARMSVCSLHAHNVTGLGPGDARERQHWLDALMRLTDVPVSHALQGQIGPARTGRLLGGNLTLVHQCVIAGRWRVPRGSLLFFEEVSEAPYRVARLLLGLESAGVFDDAAGIVVGHLSPRGPDGRAAECLEAFVALAKRNHLSLGWGLQAGHERPNSPLVLGALGTLANTQLVLEQRA